MAVSTEYSVRAPPPPSFHRTFDPHPRSCQLLSVGVFSFRHCGSDRNPEKKFTFFFLLISFRKTPFVGGINFFWRGWACAALQPSRTLSEMVVAIVMTMDAVITLMVPLANRGNSKLRVKFWGFSPRQRNSSSTSVQLWTRRAVAALGSITSLQRSQSLFT